MSSFLQKLKSNKVFNALILACLFFFTERTLRNNFLFVCTYRMQFIAKVMPIACAWVIFIAFAIYAKRNPAILKSCSVVAWYLGIYLAYLIPTLIHGGYLPRWADSLVYSLPPFFLATLAMDNEKSKKLFISVAAWTFTVMSALNLVFILFPGSWSLISEWSQEYFLGFHTQIGFILVLGAFFVLLTGKTYLQLLYLCLMAANAVFIMQGTVLAGVVLMVFLLIPPVKRLVSKIPLWVFVVLIVAVFVVLVCFLEKITKFEPIMTFMWYRLEKDWTLSGRYYIWNGYANLVKDAPLLGHGLGQGATYFFEASDWNKAFVHAHSNYLQTLYEGGIVTLAVSLLMIVGTSRKLKTSAVSSAVKASLIPILIMLLVDLDAYYPWYLVAFICHIGVLYDSKEQTSN